MSSRCCVAFLSLLVGVLTGCATIERGTRQRIHVVSEPSGASISTEHCGLAGGTVGSTPATISVSRRSSHCAITVMKPGYRSATAPLVRQFDPFAEVGVNYGIPASPQMFGPLLAWGSLVLGGIVVDSVTGAAFVMKPEEMRFRLYPNDDVEAKAGTPELSEQHLSE